MARPSAPLLSWLRDMLKQKGLNTAHVADASGLPRPRVRKILAGTDDMTVDELMLLSETLQLDPSDLSAQALAEARADAEPTKEDPPEVDPPRVDPWGNQPQQLFEIAFALGCDFFFLADTSEIQDSGVPTSVLEQYGGRELPIKLEAAYHKYNDPKYDPTGITLTLSFDKLYDCHFKWTAIRQFVLFPLAPDPDATDGDSEDAERPSGVPHLRLVT